MAFEHIIGLLSFVYALALTHLLLSVASLLRAGRRVRFSWIYAGWMLNACVLIIENWIVFYGLRSLTIFSVGTIFFLFAFGCSNYMYAALVAADAPPDGEIDLWRLHTEQGRLYLPAFVACCIFALLTTTVVAGRFNGIADWATHNLTLIPMTLAAIVGCLTLRIAWVQAIVLAVIFASWGYFIVLLQGVMR